jgi:hypothetical protein
LMLNRRYSLTNTYYGLKLKGIILYDQPAKQHLGETTDVMQQKTITHMRCKPPFYNSLAFNPMSNKWTCSNLTIIRSSNTDTTQTCIGFPCALTPLGTNPDVFLG